MVTYTSISFDSDLPQWGFHLMDLEEFEAPQSLEPAPPSPDYVPGPEYLEYLASFDDEISIKDQSLPVDTSSTALSPGYVAEFDPLDEDPREDLTDYPTDGGDDEGEKEESSKDDDDDKEASEEDEEEDEEHLAPADSTTLLAINLVPLAEETELSDIPEADKPSRKRLCLTDLASRFEVGESSTVADIGQIRHTLARMVDYEFVDTLDASSQASEDDRSTALEALIRAQETHIITLEAHIRALQRDVSMLQRQRIDDGNRLTMHIQHEHDRHRELERTGDAERQDRPTNAGKTLKKMMTAKYSPISEIKKLEIKIWNLKVKGTNAVSYTHHFQELALMCGRMFLEEFDELEKYVGELPDMIQARQCDGIQAKDNSRCN
uniref:Reverse transcriptase domain-containing protein n=1 Tax=Tanacetum cinerariifolium TaxID=118510 RepID=A0A699GWN2_TANCI|nr:reverse transcriptase domain-containing protein [Tanacetum cinerariifolium]